MPAESINTPNPTEPTNPISADLKRNCILGGLVFLMLAASAVLLVHFVGDGFKEKMAVIRRSETVKKRDKKYK